MADKRMFDYTKFTLIGGIVFGKDNVVTTEKLSPTSLWNRTKLNIGIKADTNTQFLNCEYIHSASTKTCKLWNSELGKSFEVNLEDTIKQSNINKVADFMRIKVDIEEDFEKKKEIVSLIFKRMNHEKAVEKTEDDLMKIEEYTKQINELQTNRHEFVHMKDVIEFINKNQEIFKNKKIKVTGNPKYDTYRKGYIYSPSVIEFVEDDTEDCLNIITEVFYDKDSVQDIKSEKKIIINGYVGENIKKEEKLFPLTTVINYSKIDEDNPVHVQILDFMKDIFEIKNKKQFHKTKVEIDIINGSEKKEFDETCLNDKQKLAMLLGKAKLNDFKPKGNLYGERTTELRVTKPILTGDFANGSVEIFPIDLLVNFLVEDDSDIKLPKEKEEKSNEEDKKMEETVDDLMKLFK